MHTPPSELSCPDPNTQRMPLPPAPALRALPKQVVGDRAILDVKSELSPPKPLRRNRFTVSAAQLIHQHVVKALPLEHVVATASKVCTAASRWARWVASHAVRFARKISQWVIQTVYTYTFRPLINLAIRDVRITTE